MVYGSMLSGRLAIVRNSGFQFAKAVTIATRYSIVREQGSSLGSDNHTETAIIAYKHQHYRLLTLISQTYAILFAGQRSKSVHLDLLTRQHNGDHSTLPFVHALMCGLKAWSTQMAANGVEDARKMCGGHGYLNMSGIPEIVAAVSGACTFEGDNWILWGQVARYLMKGMDATILPADMAYIDFELCNSTEETKCHAHGKTFLDLATLTGIFKHRAARLIRDVHLKINVEVTTGTPRAKAMNKFVLDLTVAARSHIELYILEASIHQLDLVKSSTSAQTNDILHRIIALFALTTIASPLAPYTSTFIGDMYFSYTQIFEITELIDELLNELLPEVITLTDAFSFTDGCLSSAIGCKDGDIYRRLMAWTKQLPINVEAEKNGGVFKKGWEQYIKPFLDENRGLASNLVGAKL
jgi:acyl-CoA oxidase